MQQGPSNWHPCAPCGGGAAIFLVYKIVASCTQQLHSYLSHTNNKTIPSQTTQAMREKNKTKPNPKKIPF